MNHRGDPRRTGPGPRGRRLPTAVICGIVAAALSSCAGPGGAGVVQFPGEQSPAAHTAYRDGTYQGDAVPNQFGDVQVSVVISGGRISDVQAITLPSDRQRSAEISQRAAPLLHDEILSAQSAIVDVVSGATYTSDGYAQSVQSALDRAV
jgi:uncharacterized protein with FMN-binding domain